MSLYLLLKMNGGYAKKQLASSPPKDYKFILLPSQRCSSEGESSFSAAERLCEMVKVSVLGRQLLLFLLGATLPDLLILSVISSTKTFVLDALVPKPGCELSLVNAVPRRIAFEIGKECHSCFSAITRGTSGWVLLAEESPIKQHCGIVRVVAPLSGSDNQPNIDERHPMWLHLRIRPSTSPFLDPSKFDCFNKRNAWVDGRWTLAFKDEQACKAAESMLVEERDVLQIKGKSKTFLSRAASFISIKGFIYSWVFKLFMTVVLMISNKQGRSLRAYRLLDKSGSRFEVPLRQV